MSNRLTKPSIKVFLYHRDLRWQDNIGLNELLKKSNNIALLFIFTEQQIQNNNWFSPRAFNYMLHCLRNLNQSIPLNFMIAKSEVTALTELIKNNIIECIYTNYDFTPFAQKRHLLTKKLLEKHHINYYAFQDYLLFKPGAIRPQSKPHGFFQVFTPFWKQMLTYNNLIKTPIYENIKNKNFIKLNNTLSFVDLPFKLEPVRLPSQRSEVLNQINNIALTYKTDRDYFDRPGTTLISAAIKFGVISMREAWFGAKKRFKETENSFSRQLAWREFFYHTTFLAQKNHVWKWGDNWRSKFNNLHWSTSKIDFQKWCDGETGYALIDAAMNQLNQTGYMHNRGRLLVASFLTKNLMIHWSWGEKYFAQKLIDYDPIVNAMSWQWVAGCGLDAAPYFRIFNPERQQELWDPAGIYVKKYGSPNYVKPMIEWRSSRENYLKKVKNL